MGDGYLLTFAASSISSTLATTTSSNTVISASSNTSISSAATLLSAPTSHKYGLSSGALAAIRAAIGVMVLIFALLVGLIFLRRRNRGAGGSPRYPHNETPPGPQELEPKDVQIEGSLTQRPRAKPIHPPEETKTGPEELVPKDTQINGDE